MLVFLEILVALGVEVDVVHTAVLSQAWVSRPLAVVEEGGEMIVMSFIFRNVFREWHEETTALRPPENCAGDSVAPRITPSTSTTHRDPKEETVL